MGKGKFLWPGGPQVARPQGFVFVFLHLLAFVQFVALGIASENVDLHAAVLALLQHHFIGAGDIFRWAAGGDANRVYVQQR